jgi:GNAT superfamily N-acetyltransferase
VDRNERHIASDNALPEIITLRPEAYDAAIPGLADLLVDAVEGGASVNFLAGFTVKEAADWWRARADQLADGTITAFVAHDADGRILGCTLLMRSRNPNSPHRAEIGKVLVHRPVRRQGLARRLMTAAEDAARAEGRWLLILDTQTESDAEHLYRALGWTEFGQVPNHSMLTDGTLSPTTFFWKDLR